MEDFLKAFLDTQRQTPPQRYCLIADELSDKFSDQADEDFQAMREEYDRVLMIVADYGGTLFRKKEEVVTFASDLDKKLPSLEEVGAAQ